METFKFSLNIIPNVPTINNRIYKESQFSEKIKEYVSTTPFVVFDINQQRSDIDIGSVVGRIVGVDENLMVSVELLNTPLASIAKNLIKDGHISNVCVACVGNDVDGTIDIQRVTSLYFGKPQ